MSRKIDDFCNYFLKNVRNWGLEDLPPTGKAANGPPVFSRKKTRLLPLRIPPRLPD